MSGKLNQYKGMLKDSEIASGMNLTNTSAKRLLEDAKLLFENERFPSAAALAVLSVEESGKVTVLRQLALCTTEEEAKDIWRDYRSHKAKNYMWIVPDLVFSGAIKLEDFRVAVDPASDHPLILDNVKQISFYSDCLGAKHWSLPTEVVDKECAKAIILSASALVRSKHHTEKEIELWKRFIGPVFKKSMEEMKKGLLAWFREMTKEGLMENKGILYEDFVGSIEPQK